MTILIWATVPIALLTSAALFITHLFHKAAQHRRRIREVQKLGLPMPKWSPIFGHFPTFLNLQKQLPTNTFMPVQMSKICEEFQETDMFYLQPLPFMKPRLMVNDPQAAIQATIHHGLERPPIYKDMFDPIMGGSNLLSMKELEWKHWRGVFNPAFSHSYLLEQVPAVVESTQIFCQKLRERARTGTAFPLEDPAARLTVEIIFKLAMNDKTEYQHKPNPMADSLRNLLGWTNFGNILLRIHPVRPLAVWYYNWVIGSYTKHVLSTRFEEAKRDFLRGDGKVSKNKSVISLALRDYLKNKSQEAEVDENTKMDSTFATFVRRQMRLFLWAGHDTTTAVLVFTYHLLSKTPHALAAMRAEHDTVLGVDPDDAAEKLSSNPSLLNQLTYTLAAIKETMRMYPPAGAERSGRPGVFLTDRHGTQYPTENFHISIQHQGLHYNPRLWPHPKEYLPERFTVEPGHELYPINGAFRPFEHGARNCMGQNLALIEMRTVLALTIRKFDIKPAYEEWDEIKPKGWLQKLGLSGKGLNNIDGERAYQVEKGAAHPAEGYPCRITYLGKD